MNEDPLVDDLASLWMVPTRVLRAPGERRRRVSGLVERVARAMWQATAPGGIYDLLADQQKQQICAEARAAIREVLAALRESDASVYTSFTGCGEELARFLAAFAREHGLEPAEGGTEPRPATPPPEG